MPTDGFQLYIKHEASCIINMCKNTEGCKIRTKLNFGASFKTLLLLKDYFLSPTAEEIARIELDFFIFQVFHSLFNQELYKPCSIFDVQKPTFAQKIKCYQKSFIKI